MANNLNVWAWSVTPVDNATADGLVNWAEGQDPATVNDSARGMMAGIAKMTRVQSGNVTVGGTADAITITTGQAISSGHQALGFRLCFKASATNTGATTIAVDGLSAVAIKRPNNDALSAGDIVSGGFHDIAFDGTNYKLLAATGAAGTYGALAADNVWTGYNGFAGNTVVGDMTTDGVMIQGTWCHPATTALFGSSSVAALRTAMGLGTAATQNTGTSGATVPVLNGANAWSASQTVTTIAGSTPLFLAHPASAGTPNLYSNLTSLAATSYHTWFLSDGVINGSITTTSVPLSGVAYNTTSDDRLKSGSRPLDDSGAIIDQLAPIRFTWNDGGAEDFGFSAQALHKVVPQAATPGKGKPGDEDFVPWMREKGALEAILVAEIKALRARVAALEAG